MAKGTRNSLKYQSLFRAFFTITDPRVQGRCQYPLFTILVITLCALICGFDTWKGIELFAKKRKRWLSQFIDLSCGIPSHFTFARIFSLINPEEFNDCLMNWIAELCQLVTWDLISIDGKTSRGSKHVAAKKKADHIVNAFSARHKTCLGNVKTPDKSNEIKGIPILLKQLNPAGCIISIDAMGTQKGIANLIREKKAHYVLSLKKNHKRFHRKVKRLFEQAEDNKYKAMLVCKDKTKDYGHARIEEREYFILPVMYLPQFKKIWRDLEAFICVKRTRIFADGTSETKIHYYITSIPIRKYKKTCQAIREHWGIENKLHYKLDVGMHEDQCPIFRGHAAQNLATMRKMVLALLERENSQMGIAMKRSKAAICTRYLRKVVGF